MNSVSPGSRSCLMNHVHLHSRASRWSVTVGRALLLVFLLASLGAAHSNEDATQPNEPKRVLILMQEDLSWPVFRAIDENARTTLRAGSPEGILIFSEAMDLTHFPDPMSQAQKKTWIQKKYAELKLDLVIGVGDVPTDLFPSVPLVYLSVAPQSKPAGRLGANRDAAGIWIQLGAGKTIEAARRIQPDARQVVVVVGSSPTESLLLDQVRKQMAGYSQQLQIIYLTDLGFSEILKRVEPLGPESVVLFVAFTRDRDGRPIISADAIGKIAAVSGAPVYALFDPAIGSGAVGGYVTRFNEVGKQAAELGLQLLAGQHPQDQVARSGYVFDWRQLQRWKLSPSALPVGSILLNRQPTAWETYRRYILGAILLFLGETLLIVALLWQRARKRKYQQSLVNQIAFESMLADLSTTFINLPEEEIGATIENSFERIAEFLKIDRITLYEYSPATAEFTVTFSWHRHEIQPAPSVIPANKLPWLTERLLHGEVVSIYGPESLPDESSAEREHVRSLAAVSVAVVPLKAGEHFFGAISFTSMRRRVLWTESLVGQLKLLAEIFSNALMRKRAQEVRFRHTAIVESSDDAIISKNLDGIILSWNASAERIFGFSEAEAVGQPMTIIIPNELHQEEDDILHRSRAGERMDHYETIRLTKDRKKLNVLLTVFPVRDSKGVIVGACKIARDITGQKWAEQVLRKSEEQFRLFMDHSPAVAWMKDEQGHYIYVSEAYQRQLGVGLEDRQGKTDFEVYPWVIAEQLTKNDQLALAAGHAIEVIEESMGPGGEPRTWLTYKFPFQDAAGQNFVGGIGIDITERKKAEETLHDLTGRLIAAQEEERARIARELHDDFSQRLALLGIGLGQLWKKLPASAVEDRASVLEMLAATREVSTDLHTLSHQLHSSRLEHVGLVSALHGLCKELSEKYKMQIHFTDHESPVTIPKDVALCLFRVAQEGLTNVIKHSRMKEAEVEIGEKEGRLWLRISDRGKGFDPEIKKPGVGIGLVGMSERLRLVGGRLLVKSGPNRGTEILAEVPLAVSAKEEDAKTQTAGI
jgi:PAS domain S-box-containing protein